MTPDTLAAEAAILATVPGSIIAYGKGTELAEWLWTAHGARPSLASIERERARRQRRPDPTTSLPRRGRDDERNYS